MNIRRITACGVLAAMTLSALNGCRKSDPLDTAVIGENSFVMTIYPDIAPVTCENFQQLVEEGFYNGLTFHRVVDDFVAQGGDPNGDGTGSAKETIKGEFSANGVSNNLSHVKGTVSMARADDYDSASCQFFICLSDLTYLDGSYAAFGNVTEGMEVVDKFQSVPRSVGRMGETSSPDVPICIQYAGLIEADSAGNPRIQFLINMSGGENGKETQASNTEQTTVSSVITTEVPATTTAAGTGESTKPSSETEFPSETEAETAAETITETAAETSTETSTEAAQ